MPDNLEEKKLKPAEKFKREQELEDRE